MGLETDGGGSDGDGLMTVTCFDLQVNSPILPRVGISGLSTSCPHLGVNEQEKWGPTQTTLDVRTFDALDELSVVAGPQL